MIFFSLIKSIIRVYIHDLLSLTSLYPKVYTLSYFSRNVIESNLKEPFSLSLKNMTISCCADCM